MWIPPEKDHLHEPQRGFCYSPSNRKWLFRALAIVALVSLHWHFFSKSVPHTSTAVSPTSSPASSIKTIPASSPSATSSPKKDASSDQTPALDKENEEKPGQKWTHKVAVSDQNGNVDQTPVLAKGPLQFSKELKKFWHKLANALMDSEPCIELKDNSEEALIFGFSKGHLPTERQDTLHLPSEDIAALRESHSNFTSHIGKLAKRLPYKKKSQGIVMTAGGDHLAELFTTLRILRNTGSNLPVEVFLESHEAYKPGICEDILPSLNAKCAIFSDILDGGAEKVTLQRFQYKVFAVLFSSFEDVLLLDADNLPLRRPEDIMNAEPFTDTGLITWPDYWAVTSSPAFFDIASIDVPPPVSARASSESGQLMISKSKHAETLLLATYYNVFGMTHYYTLLSQHAIGQGDKETWLAAALALNASFYDVKSELTTPGFEPKGPGAEGKERYQGSGCIQRDPRDDANAFFTDVRPAFFHAQTYKLTPFILPERWFHEINGRMWGDEKRALELFAGRDLEKEAWREMEWTACELGQYFQELEEDKKAEACETVRWIRSELFGGKKGTNSKDEG